MFDALSGLGRIYDRAEERMAAFAAKSRIACPAGCGRCCEPFVPDMLPLEAAWMASWLIHHEPSRAWELATAGFSLEERGSGRCPFYAVAGSYHCGIYGGRALVCRLFGFSGGRAKDGQETFALCKHMLGLAGSERRSWKGAELTRDLRAAPPLMSDFAAELVAIRPSESRERRLIIDALPDALKRVYFLIGFGPRVPSEDPDGTEPENPLPAAG